MKFKLEPYAFPPVREHREDAGIDLRTPVQFTIQPHSSYIIDTGVHVDIPIGWVGLLRSCHGLLIRRNIFCEDMVKTKYTGGIFIKLYNLGDFATSFKVGDKIARLVVVPCMLDDVEIVNEISGGERGDNGFGSTGR